MAVSLKSINIANKNNLLKHEITFTDETEIIQKFTSFVIRYLVANQLEFFAFYLWLNPWKDFWKRVTEISMVKFYR